MKVLLFISGAEPFAVLTRLQLAQLLPPSYLLRCSLTGALLSAAR